MGTQPNLNRQRTSITAIIAVVLTIITLPSIFCVVGYGTGALAVLFGIIAVVQYNNGDCSKTSAVMGGFAIVVSLMTILGYSLLLGGTMWSALDEADNAESIQVNPTSGGVEAVSRIEIDDWSYGVTEKNNIWWRYAWTAKLRNNTKRARSVDVEVKYLTEAGLKVDSDREYNVSVPAGGERTVEGDTLVRCPGCQNVTNAKIVID